MSTPASIAGHPLHPMLVTIPIGLWVFSLVADFIAIGTGAPLWAALSFYTLLGGEIGAVVAAVPGLIDFKHVRDRHGPSAARVVLWHLILNVFVVCMVALNLLLRASVGMSGWTLGLSVLTVGVLGVSGWLGGELVHVLGVSTARNIRAAPTPAPDAGAAEQPGKATRRAQRGRA